MKWTTDSRIMIDPPKKPKKITGTKLAAIMGLNAWSSEFAVWCDITRTWKDPFVENKYTRAGKIIEPKQAEYMRRFYNMPNLLTPSAAYGGDPYETMHGDFFPDIPIFGGMWDYIDRDENDVPCAVLEMKTSKRSEDWENGTVPEYYALQAALYAYLLNLDEVYMVVSFLEDKDYDHPEAFIPSAKNTAVIPFRMRERYPDFELIIRRAIAWWNAHVKTGMSPIFDEKKDADILKELRTNSLNPETNIFELLREAEAIQAEIESVNSSVGALKKRLTVLTGIIKEYAEGQFREGDTVVEMQGPSSVWKYSLITKTAVDEDALKADGLYGKYVKETRSFRLTNKPIEQ